MAQCISRPKSSIYGEMTEGITHCRIIMGKGGWGMEHRERDKNIGTVALTGPGEAGVDRWPNTGPLVKRANIKTLWQGLCWALGTHEESHELLP